MKTWEKNTGENLQYLRLDKEFLDLTPKGWNHKKGNQ